jgi:hypothetical protein
VIITLVFEKNANFFAENCQKSQKIVIITLVFEKNANFFRRKLSKIAENCDHNIDPPVALPSAFFPVYSKAEGIHSVFLALTLESHPRENGKFC